VFCPGQYFILAKIKHIFLFRVGLHYSPNLLLRMLQ
jgi:hypothetical protein